MPAADSPLPIVPSWLASKERLNCPPVSDRTVTTWISPVVLSTPGRSAETVIDLPPCCVVVTSTRGPGWKMTGPTSRFCEGLRSTPKVAWASRVASGMMSPVVCTPARLPRLAPKSTLNPPAAAILLTLDEVSEPPRVTT